MSTAVSRAALPTAVIAVVTAGSAYAVNQLPGVGWPFSVWLTIVAALTVVGFGTSLWLAHRQSSAEPPGQPVSEGAAVAGNQDISARDGSMAAGLIGSVTVHDHPPADTPPAPGQIVFGAIPGEPTHFVTRADLDRLVELSERSRVVSVVTGMRGVGKTHLAAALARRRIGEGCRLVAWIDASSADATIAGLAEVAGRLGIADPEGDSVTSAERLRDHLAVSADPGLVVFDDATEPDRIRPHIPATGAVRMVITSTDRSFVALGESVDLEVYEREESVRFLRSAAGIDAEGADRIADTLGDLPLALAAAAAVLTASRRRPGVDAYLARLRNRPLPESLERRPGFDYPMPVVNAILESLYAVEASAPDAAARSLIARLLGVVAHLAPEGVGRQLLAGLLDSPAAAEPVDTALLDRTIEGCVVGSILSWSADGKSVRMHGLTARIVRERAGSGGSFDEAVRVIESWW